MTEKKIKQNMKNNSIDVLIDQINNTADDVQRERGVLFEKLGVAYRTNAQILEFEVKVE